MAEERTRPYSNFNFRVSWAAAPDNEGEPLGEQDYQAGFQEVSGLGMEITVAEYRAGNHGSNEPIKVTGLVKTPDVTFKRGVTHAVDLFRWLNEIRDGAQNQLKNVTVKLMGEDRETTVQTWSLKNARPMKYTGPALNGKSSDVAVEELVLAAERIELEEAKP